MIGIYTVHVGPGVILFCIYRRGWLALSSLRAGIVRRVS